MHPDVAPVGGHHAVVDVIICLLGQALVDGIVNALQIVGVDQRCIGAHPVADDVRHGIAENPLDPRGHADHRIGLVRLAAVQEAIDFIEDAELKSGIFLCHPAPPNLGDETSLVW
jgi:hypothetical protein